MLLQHRSFDVFEWFLQWILRCDAYLYGVAAPFGSFGASMTSSAPDTSQSSLALVHANSACACWLLGRPPEKSPVLVDWCSSGYRSVWLVPCYGGEGGFRGGSEGRTHVRGDPPQLRDHHNRLPFDLRGGRLQASGASAKSQDPVRIGLAAFEILGCCQKLLYLPTFETLAFFTSRETKKRVVRPVSRERL